MSTKFYLLTLKVIYYIKNYIENKCHERLNKNLKQDILKFANKNFLNFTYEVSEIDISIKFNYSFDNWLEQDTLVYNFHEYMYEKYCKNENIFYYELSRTGFHDYIKGYKEAEQMAFTLRKK